jgi:tetratricopeptide (TPR) repeat protein
MKQIIAIFLFALALPLHSKSNEQLRKAEAAYDAKKYREAATIYEALVKDGYKSYQLYYNLGNASYRNGDLGKAIYYYELARKLEPDDEDVKVNLGIASAKTVDQIDAKENFLISAVKTSLLSSLSTKSWAWLSIISILGSALCFFFFIAAQSVALKRAGFVASCVFMIGFALSYFLGWSASRAKYENKFAIILAKEIKVMNEPTAAATGKFELHEGTKVRVLETNGDWLLLKLDNGNEGWVKLEDVGVI